MLKELLKCSRKKPSKSFHSDSTGEGKVSSDYDRNGEGGVGSYYDPNSMYEALPRFKDVQKPQRPILFIEKLNMCCVVFDFSDSSKHLKEKEIKRRTLLEVVDYVTSVKVKFNDAAMKELMDMAAVNLFRTLRSHDRDDKEPLLEPAWFHIQLVYEILLTWLESPMTDVKLAERYINVSFIENLLDLFDSEDPREREYLKTILHRLYGKFMVHRRYIRHAILNTFHEFISKPEKHNGVVELLEVCASIVNGFVIPLKEEYTHFLKLALIPLYGPESVPVYHEQLSYCIFQFVEKDVKLVDTVITALLDNWPETNRSNSKEVRFLLDLEEALKVTSEAEFKSCIVPLFNQIAKCLSSLDFQVAKTAVFLWNNDHIRNLMNQNYKVLKPIVSPALEGNPYGHWNQAVQSLNPNAKNRFCKLAGIAAISAIGKTVEFTLDELKDATGNFNESNKIGHGGYGDVYFAELRGQKGAIKKMKMNSPKQFFAELDVLTCVHHVNLVHLIGYCVKESLFVVYEYVENGNLQQHLRGSRGPLPWDKRVHVALDSAKGIEYIHEGTVQAYIHRDIKSSNILINKSFKAKVADFGLAKVGEVTESSTRGPMGTYGYMAPEIANGKVSAKGDVYAFGVVLYELISAKDALIDPGGESITLVSVFEEEVFKETNKEQEALQRIIDPRLGDNYPFDSVYEMAKLGRACTQDKQQLRPRMRDIVAAIRNIVDALSPVDCNVADFHNQRPVYVPDQRPLLRSKFFGRSTDVSDSLPPSKFCRTSICVPEAIPLHPSDVFRNQNLLQPRTNAAKRLEIISETDTD